MSFALYHRIQEASSVCMVDRFKTFFVEILGKKSETYVCALDCFSFGVEILVGSAFIF